MIKIRKYTIRSKTQIKQINRKKRTVYYNHSCYCNSCNRQMCLLREFNVVQPCQFFSKKHITDLILYFKMREYLQQNNIKILLRDDST